MLNLFFQLICFGFLLLIYIFSPDIMDKQFISIVLAINSLVLFLFIVKNKNIRKGLFRHSTIFLFGFFVVHFQLLFKYVLDKSINLRFDVWIDNSIVCKSLAISSLGFVSFLIGYQICSFKDSSVKKNIQSERMSKSIVALVNPKYLIWPAWGLFLLFIINANPLYLAGYYGSVYMGDLATYINMVFGLVINAMIIINSWNIKIQDKRLSSFWEYVKSYRLAFLVLLFIYSALMLFIGDRGPVISFALIFMGGYGFYRRGWPKTHILICLMMAGAFVLTIIGIARSYDKDIDFVERISLALSASEDNSSNFDSTSELAGSVRTLHYAVSAVPDKFDYSYGRFQVQQVLSVIPGFGSFVNNYIDSRFQYKSSASFITYLEQGSNPTSGAGTTCVADFYLDFGLFGVIVGMFVFGFFVCNLEFACFSKNIPSLLVWVFIMVYFSKSLYIGRSTVLFVLKESLLTFVIVWGYNYILRKRR